MARITVGMPVYNGAATLDRAIAGLEAQTRGDFVVIAADNGSTDGTAEALDAWAARDSRVTVHRHDENIGALGNFSYVLDLAETDYFMWHACDDWLSPNYLDRLYAMLDANRDCALACANATRVEMDGSPKSRNATRPCPDFAERARRSRIVALLRRPEAVWIYGLFRTARLRAVQEVATEFGYVWASDRLMLLPFILGDLIRGVPEAHFYSEVTDTSSQLYRPASLGARFRFMARYLVFTIRIYQASGLSLFDKLVLLPWLLWHTSRTSRSGFYRFNLKRSFKIAVGWAIK
ncbi:MAG: glycosyltransferase family 2 protein [Alphaproteobacteria bacterium]